MDKKVLVVDLDGTLYATNTFHQFLLYIVLECIKNLRIVPMIQFITFMVLRVFKIFSHAKMKYQVLKVMSGKNWLDYSKFVNNISKYKRDLKIDKSKFDIKILATAAPNCYAEIIAEEENFDLCMATNFTNSTFNPEFENSKVIKKNTIVSYIKRFDIDKVDLLVTDHIDDLPIMKISKNIKIVKPSKNLIEDLKRHNITYDVIN